MALCVLDPAMDQPVGNANVLDAQDEIADVHLKDASAVLEVSHRLSDIGKAAEKERGNDLTDGESSDTSSLSDTESLPTS
jgi:hypothetical protein